MRRLFILSTVLAASVAVLGACNPKAETPNKPVATPLPVSSPSPIASPVASPAKPGSTPEVKKPDDKKTPDAKEINKGVKLQGTPIKTPR